MWSALTALALATIGSIAVGLIWTAAQVISFLQPILIPFAVAGVLAYLLDPVVSKMVSWGISRRPSVLMVFALVSALLLWGAIWFVPAISHQTVNLLHRVDDYTRTTRSHIIELGKSLRQKYGFDVLPTLDDSPDDAPDVKRVEPVKDSPDKPEGPSSEGVKAAKNGNSLEELIDVQKILKGDWLKSSLTALVNNSIRMIRSSVGGFLSVFGFLLSLIIIPIYLFYFLIDARNISESWQDYLPLRASQFKNEVVSSLTEINGYIIAFFEDSFWSA